MKKEMVLLIMILFLVSRARGYQVEDVAVVHIADDGFMPQRVQVEAGTVVIFENIGGNYHWPASNAHPTHTLYPDSDITKCGTIEEINILDSCRGLKSGEEFQFRFTSKGEWGVHDHLYPGLVMVVEVIDESAIKEKNVFLSTFIEIFNSFKRLFENIKPQNVNYTAKDFRNLRFPEQVDFMNELSGNNPVEAWEFLKKALLVNGSSLQHGHEFAHIVGNSIYRHYGVKGIQWCSRDFASGCLHGVSEQMIQDNKIDTIRKSEEECLSVFSNSSAVLRDCFHGMGHGMISREALDIGKALESCDQYSTFEYRGHCYMGAFMEYSYVRLNGLIPPNSDEDLIKWCENLPKRYHQQCATYVAQILISDSNKFPNISDSMCLNISNELVHQECYRQIGTIAAVSSTGNPYMINKTCQGMNDNDGKSICFLAAARDVAKYRYVNWGHISLNICESLQGKWKSECYNSRQYMVNKYSTSSIN